MTILIGQYKLTQLRDVKLIDSFKFIYLGKSSFPKKKKKKKKNTRQAKISAASKTYELVDRHCLSLRNCSVAVWITTSTPDSTEGGEQQSTCRRRAFAAVQQNMWLLFRGQARQCEDLALCERYYSVLQVDQLHTSQLSISYALRDRENVQTIEAWWNGLLPYQVHASIQIDSACQISFQDHRIIPEYELKFSSCCYSDIIQLRRQSHWPFRAIVAHLVQ